MLTTVALFALAWLILSWPWLSGAVTVPWDAKSQFFPQVQFLASSLGRGEAPWWTPNVYAGWPQVSDPQSLIFSPLHVLLAALDGTPGFRAVDAVSFAHVFLGGLGVILFFHDRGWHPAGALVAAISFAFAGAASARLQHTGQVISLTWLPPALWLTARALERASWRAGALAGIAAGLMAIGRDQVALLGLYVLAGFVAWHWFTDANVAACVRVSIKPLAAAAGTFTIVASVPVIMTILLAARSNRPEFGIIDAGRGSLHPAHLLTLVFADLFGAADPGVEYWGPPSLPWSEAFGWPGLYLAQNMGQVYCGALVVVTIVGLGVVRGVAWARDIRFFSTAALVILLYALGWYTPSFRLMYEVLPGVALFRRPADATFLLGALLAIVSGYLVHRWVDGAVPSSRPWQRLLEVVIAIGLVGAVLVIGLEADRAHAVIDPVITAAVFVIAAIAAMALARGLAETSALGATLVLGGFMVADLAWNNAPNESTGLPPSVYDALRLDTHDETVQLLKEHVVMLGNRRDRVELTGIGYHWPNLSLVHGFEHLFGQNPLRLKWFYDATHAPDTVAAADQRAFSPLFPSYRSPLADLFGLRFIATGVPVEKIDAALKAGDLTLIARTADAYVYENPRALPRVMLLTDWRIADFAELSAAGWPAFDPHRTVLLEHMPRGAPPPAGTAAGSARIVRYANTEVVISVDAPSGGIVLLNDVWHPWWRADVDSVRTEVLKANAIFRAVVVPEGAHMVRFTFHPFAGAWQEIAGKL